MRSASNKKSGDAIAAQPLPDREVQHHQPHQHQQVAIAVGLSHGCTESGWNTVRMSDPDPRVAVRTMTCDSADGWIAGRIRYVRSQPFASLARPTTVPMGMPRG